MFTLQPQGEIEKIFKQIGGARDAKDSEYVVIDCIVYQQLCSEMLIYDFPSVYFKGGNSFFEFSWEFTMSDLIEFDMKMRADSVIDITSNSELQEFKKKAQCAFLLVHDPDIDKVLMNENFYSYFEDLAGMYKQNHIYFAKTSNMTLMKNYRTESYNGPILVRVGSEENYACQLDLHLSTLGDINDFLARHACMLNMHITYSNWNEAKKCFKDKIIAIQFIDGENSEDIKQVEILRGYMWNEQQHNENRYGAAYIDVRLYPKLAKHFNISRSYAILIQDNRADRKSYYLGDKVFKNYEEFFLIMDKIWEFQDISEFTKDWPAKTEIKLRYLAFALVIPIIAYITNKIKIL